MQDSTTTLNILQDLIRIDTQNPPGNEGPLVAYIKGFCDRLGVASTVYTYDENRANIVIRMGKSRGRNLVILGHTDVVMADASAWKHDPLGAEIEDGYLYGRGTLDMKYFIAAALSTIQVLQQHEDRLHHKILFLFTADEETGSSFGLPRLLQEPGIAEELSGSIVLNEGGGFSLFENGRCHYLYETGQKSVSSIRVTVPRLADSNPYFPSLEHERLLLEAIHRLQHMKLDESIPATIQSLQATFMQNKEPEDIAVQRLIETMSSSMITATIIHGGSRNPKLDSDVKASVDFDCRLLPHISQGAFEKKVEETLKDLPVQYTILRYSQGYEAQVDAEVTSMLERILKRHDPEIVDLLPFITPGSNDGKHLLPLGCDVIGFAPLAKEQPFTAVMPLIHGVDERIALNSIEFCTKILSDVCVEYLTGAEYRG